MNKEKQYIIIKLCEIEKQIKNLSKEEEHRTILDKIVTIKKSLFEVECLVFNRYLDECNINNLQKQSIQKFIPANKIFTINSKYLTDKDL